MGVGSTDYGDDGFGIRLAEKLERNLANRPNGPIVIDAGTMPERYTGRVADEAYDSLVFFDAVDFGGEPGDVLVADSEEMESRFPQISTHKISLGMLARWIESGGVTKAWLIGVQPESLKMGQGISPTVQNTLDILEELLNDMWCKETDNG
jgi:hydrogenase 3 maturation protease